MTSATLGRLDGRVDEAAFCGESRPVNPLQRRLLKRLEEVKEGATMCPGRLARDCGSTLAVARPDLVALARSRKIVVSQGGRQIGADGIRGPFRVRLP